MNVELIDEELIEKGIDGGYWNLYVRTYDTPIGEVQYSCEGDEYSEHRTNYTKL